MIVLDAGRIAEFASPAELINNPVSIFHGMAKNAGLLSQTAVPDLMTVEDTPGESHNKKENWKRTRDILYILHITFTFAIFL